MNAIKRTLTLALVTMPLLALLGCPKQEKAQPAGSASGATSPAPKILKLAFVTNNPSQFWKIAEAGIKKYEKESKVQVDLKMPQSGTPADQNQILQNLASQGYDAVA